MLVNPNATHPIDVVGLSISNCIPPIAEGKIPAKIVVKLIGGTLFDDMDDLWGEYSQRHWGGRMLRARSIFYDLVKENRIDQPRLRSEEPPDPSSGIWMIGNRHFDTPGLLKLLKSSTLFLDMPQAEIRELIQTMPQDVLMKFRSAMAVGSLKCLKPDFLEIAESSSEPEIAGLIKERLIEFFRTAPEFSPREAYAECVFFLQDYLRSLKQPAQPKAPAQGAKMVKHSQYRPSIKLPEDS